MCLNRIIISCKNLIFFDSFVFDQKFIGIVKIVYFSLFLHSQKLDFRNNFDDTEDSILKRIENFNAKTKPIVSKFNGKIVNAERSAVDIFADVEKIIAQI